MRGSVGGGRGSASAGTPVPVGSGAGASTVRGRTADGALVRIGAATSEAAGGLAGPMETDGPTVRGMQGVGTTRAGAGGQGRDGSAGDGAGGGAGCRHVPTPPISKAVTRGQLRSTVAGGGPKASTLTSRAVVVRAAFARERSVACVCVGSCSCRGCHGRTRRDPQQRCFVAGAEIVGGIEGRRFPFEDVPSS